MFMSMPKAIATGLLAAALANWSGCAGPSWSETPYMVGGMGQPGPPVGQAQPAGLANPLFIPIADPLCAWETVVDVVDDYFRIEREEPVRRMGDTLIEGGITTVPEVSPTVFEPCGATRPITTSGSRTRCKPCGAGPGSA